jgi:EAL domain-containing protein (putative c-di-GMP-specific phosphodiesterase class I)
MISPESVREGMERGEFFLEYLPTVSLLNRRCVGGEALMRWRRPTGVVPPNDFIPLVESTPVGGILTYWVIDTVAAELNDWFRFNSDVHVSINIPPAILGRGAVVYAGEKSGLSEFWPQVVLEITERGVPDQLGLAGLEALSKSGIRIALDDVTLSGTHLALLLRCPFDIIKLDRSLTMQITLDRPSPEWLGGLAKLLESTKVEVIAEGVESEDQVQALLAAGITMAQGFYFSRPVSAAKFREFHAAQNLASN